MRHDGAPELRVLRIKWHRAARGYRCETCGGPIKKGERYGYYVYMQDGLFCAERHHEYFYKCLAYDDEVRVERALHTTYSYEN